jgi:superfamily II DNA or RNA helicase
MLATVFDNHIRRQRPYYLLVSNPIKGVDGCYWLVFAHRDNGNDGSFQHLFKRLFNVTQTTHKLLCLDLQSAEVYTYVPKHPKDIPSSTVLRTASRDSIEQFLSLEEINTDFTLWQGSFKEVAPLNRHYDIPEQLAEYDLAISQILERSTIYRRSTAYFDSGILKLYEEPLKEIIRADGKICLLMDWQGFTKQHDVEILERLHNPDYLRTWIAESLQEFLLSLEENEFSSTEILAELVRLKFLQIKLVKMQRGRGLYHRKTGILSDSHNNHILHEGSDNFTRAAHSCNAESITFFKSWDTPEDREAISKKIQDFDRDWNREDISFDLTQEFLQQVLVERQHREQAKQPQTTKPIEPPSEDKNELPLPDFSEIDGFREAVEQILAGQHGQPIDFLYWLAQQQIQQFQINRSDILDKLVDEGILFQHQKDGAQHCLMVMQSFGVAVCADAVGLGKTRLAAAVALLYRQQAAASKIAIIAASKLHANWEREMSELGLQRGSHYELFNKNQMSRGGNFIENFTRFGGADFVIIDEAHEGIRNSKNRIHKLCLDLKERDQEAGRSRDYLLLTATPWNNRREDIYNLLYPFLTRPEGFKDWNFPIEVVRWFEKRDAGVNQFTDNTDLFRRVYRQIFLQRTRQQLRAAMPDLNVYAKRQAEWLPVTFEPDTETALEKIFTSFETDLFIPSADPVKYLTGSSERRSLLTNQRRFFLQRAESSMYALQQTIRNFCAKIELMQSRLMSVTTDADGLEQFLLLHYAFIKSEAAETSVFSYDEEDEDYEEIETDEDDSSESPQEKRSQLRASIEKNIHRLKADPEEAREIHKLMLAHCQSDLEKLTEITDLLVDEFVKDHKRSQVTQKVQELISQGKKVLLISTFSDTVIDYYQYMSENDNITNAGIGMAIGSHKLYKGKEFAHHNTVKNQQKQPGLQRQALFRLFAPVATCRNPIDRPSPSEEIMVLIGSETLSVGQNMQDADYLINIDLPWNPMVLEQRIGRIDRPKQHKANNIYIYYANSESQLLRQASRLKNLNKKLKGDLDDRDYDSGDLNNLGPSIYGDTAFDDPILPDYIQFITTLVRTRKSEQSNLQENIYHRENNDHNLYSQYELLFREDVSEKVRNLGEKYAANPITLGCKGVDEIDSLVAVEIDYFDPNGKLIQDVSETIYWNSCTGECDAYGIAIATTSKTPELHQIIQPDQLLSSLNNLYQQLVNVKHSYQTGLQQEEKLSDISTSSERLNRIQQRISKVNPADLPDGFKSSELKMAIQKIDTWRDSKDVYKILRDYTDGAKSQLPNAHFLVTFLADVDRLNLTPQTQRKKASAKFKLAAMLLKLSTE